MGQLEDRSGKAIRIEKLWGLSFAGAAAVSPDTLYFTARWEGRLIRIAYAQYVKYGSEKRLRRPANVHHAHLKR